MYKTVAIPNDLHAKLQDLAKKKSKELGGMKVPLYIIIKEAIENEHFTSDQKPDSKHNTKFCKTCSASLPSEGLEYCADNFSCGNHLHVLGKPHNKVLCSFCSFPEEVSFAIEKRKSYWSWDRISVSLSTTPTNEQVAGAVQAAKLELGEEG